MGIGLVFNIIDKSI